MCCLIVQIISQLHKQWRSTCRRAPNSEFHRLTLKKRLNYMTNSLSSGPRKGLLRIYQRKTATKGVNWAITKCKTCEYRRQLNVYVLCCSNNSNSCSCNISNSSSNKNLQSPRLICSITVGKTRPTVSSTSSLARLIHDVYGYLSLSLSCCCCLCCCLCCCFSVHLCNCCPMTMDRVYNLQLDYSQIRY